MTAPAYPPTRVTEGRRTLRGLSFPDPYDWLEQASAEVAAWQRAQAAVTERFVRDWPRYPAIRAAVERYDAPKPGQLPCHAAGLWFWLSTRPDGGQDQVLAGPAMPGPGRVVFDPAAPPGGAGARVPFVSWLAPSPDGRILALGLCHDGSENNTVTLIDVASGGTLPEPPPDPLMDNWTGGVQWLPDSSGFFYTALRGDRQAFGQAVVLHRRVPRPATVVVPFAQDPARSYPAVFVSGDGRWAVAVQGLTNPIPAAVLDLRAAGAAWRPFVTGVEGSLGGQAWGDTYYAVTDIGAPRGRLVAIDLRDEDPADPARWRELVGETEAVMRTVAIVQGRIYLTELLDTYARVRRFGLDGSGGETLPLPGRGAVGDGIFPIMNLVPRDHAGDVVFSFSTLTQGWGLYRHRLATGALETVQAPRVTLDGAVVEDFAATSPDGTRIPYHVVRPAGGGTGPRPALLFAYGGYNRALVPEYGTAAPVLVGAGALFVQAHIRGGSEFGRHWWRDGRSTRKQNCYDDLYAVAEDLVARGLTTPGQLALTGVSNGGLMAGVAATQRPELWAAVVPRVPNLDLVASFAGSYLRGSTEHGDPDDPEDLVRIASRSPYHLIRPGVRYPAVLVPAGDTDPRCPPWHARKFVARLQASQPASVPALLHVYENEGHGGATAAGTRIDQYAEWLAFVLRLTSPPGTGAPDA